MKTLFTIVMLALCASIVLGGEAGSWNYEENGPDAWPHLYSQCKGSHQSPIDIIQDSTTCDSAMEAINFINYDSLVTWKVTYDKFTAKLTPINGKLSISGSNFDTTFNLLQFHFHWGHNDYQGSEHQINNQKFPLEVHFVHQSSAGQLAVVGFLFELSDNDNSNLRSLVTSIERLNERNPSTIIKFNLASIINFNNVNTNGYYRYMGSLTTPPCSENVIWTVYEDKIQISSDQLYAFHSKLTRLTFREPQPLGTRTVLKKC